MAENNLETIKTGTVEYIDDPTCSGRVKIRVQGMHDGIPTEQLPWVSMAHSGVTSGSDGGGSISVPEVGAQVRVSFINNDPTSMEWSGNNQLDPALINEIASDYAGTTVLMYDSRQDACIKFQPGSGITLYFNGSHLQICPDNTINIHYGEGNSGTMIQLADGKVYVQGNSEVNISTPGTVSVEADTVTLNGDAAVQIKGDRPGEVAVNGNALMTVLTSLASMIDLKVPESGGNAVLLVNMLKDAMLNQQIQYI